MRPGRPRSIEDDQIAALLKRTLSHKPAAGTHWSIRQAAQASGISRSTVHRLFQAFALQPRRNERALAAVGQLAMTPISMWPTTIAIIGVAFLHRSFSKILRELDNHPDHFEARAVEHMEAAERRLEASAEARHEELMVERPRVTQPWDASRKNC